MKTEETIVASAGFARHFKPYNSPKAVYHNHYLIRLQITGSAHVTLNGAEYKLQSGDLVFVKPGDDYRLQIEGITSAQKSEESTDYFLICRGKWFEDWWADFSPPPKTNITLDENVLGSWRRLIYEKRNIHGQNEELLDYLSRVLCLSLERLIRTHPQHHSAGKESYLPYQIKQYIEKQATEPITLADVANELGVSVSSASHLFKKTFQQSIIRYLIEVRLSIAAERMLVSRLKLEDIALDSGFQSYPYFCRAFRDRFGMSPSKYRQINRMH